MILLWLFSGMLDVPGAAGRCPDFTGSVDATSFHRHLSEECTAAEREARAIPAQTILEALRQGKGVELSHVDIVGDLLFDQLPVRPIGQITGLTERAKNLLAERSVTEGRVVSGSLAIRHSHVRGRIATRIQPGQGMLMMLGPLTMSDTVFEASQDWSRTLFASLVDWSGARLRSEGLFLQGIFLDEVRFQGVRFGPHTRFHRAQFDGLASFHRAAFEGLAELLEVTFHREVSFVGTRFEQGTGFSGAVFEGEAGFSRSVFAREAYFLFAQFQQAAQFVGARFDGMASFANAQFQGRADFSDARFAHPPDWERAKFLSDRLMPPPPPAPVDWLNLSITLGAGLVAAALFWYILKRRP